MATRSPTIVAAGPGVGEPSFGRAADGLAGEVFAGEPRFRPAGPRQRPAGQTHRPWGAHPRKWPFPGCGSFWSPAEPGERVAARRVIPLIAARAKEQFRDNLAATGVHLSQQYLDRLDALSRPTLGFPADVMREASVVSGVYGAQLPDIDDSRAQACHTARPGRPHWPSDLTTSHSDGPLGPTPPGPDTPESA
jgi:hypothetical protein